MVSTRMESRLETLEKVVDGWNRDREEQATQFELQDARLKKIEDMMERLTQFLDGERAHKECIRLEPEGERWCKLEIPIFAGDDAYGWTNRLERYFHIKGVSERERMSAVMVAMEGRALSWYRWWESCNPNPSWEGFKTAMIRRFQPTMMQNPFELLLALKQTHSVEEFVEQFEKYAGALKGVEQEYLMSVFLNGLMKEIAAEVKLYEPNSLSKMMSKELMIEEKNVAVGEYGRYGGGRTVGNYRSFPSSRTVTVDTNPGSKTKGSDSSIRGNSSSRANNNTGGFKGNTGGFKRLSNEEQQEKYKKGLCFRCDEKFGPEHVCKNKQFHMLLLDEGEGEEEEEERVEEDNLEVIDKSFNALQLSLYSMEGLISSKSWKVRGTVNDQQVVALIDCGASHNFISQELVERLKLPVKETSPYTVEVGDGHKVECRGVCENLVIRIQGLRIQQDFYLFELGGADLVLGLEWLAGLGEVRADFGKLILIIGEGPMEKTMVGDPALTRSQASLLRV
ncbi:Retrotransposon gag domain [Sesbania bispinosa]|nr:Retrotransposon gag domain [Sesbania bispinosa]